MKERMITDSNLINAVINACEVCFVGMVDGNNMPYTLPFNFGYDDGILYLHSGPEGHKIKVLQQNPNVCIAMSTGHQMYHQSEEVACSYGMKYKSVLIRGKVEFIDELDEKARVMNIVMHHYVNRDDFKYSVPALKNVKVMRIVPETIDCKYFGY